ncbi:sodium-dependent transporter [bacterium AH-315-P15]|nr:sodium-dependent transporter [bacterium AH-315-P15]
MQDAHVQHHWSSRFAFVMATVGAAVGLGNFWRFPYQAGENGGGAFVLVYILVVLVIAIPLVMAELLIGRRGQLSAVGSARAVGKEQGGTGLWSIIGWVGMIASFLILTFYSVIAGWVMAYIPAAITHNAFSGGQEVVNQVFSDLLADPFRLTFWHTIFMAMTVWIVMRGLQDGIEKAALVLMPAFFVMLLFVVFYASSVGDFEAARDFLFSFRFEAVTPSVVMNAIGQAFFSVSVATAILITYGAYLDKTTNIPQSAFVVSFADTGVALLAGLAIFPLVFANGLAPDEGPGLLFVTLPLAFADLPLSQVFGTTFFVLAFFAALTSSIALLEITISWAQERGMTRGKATLFYGGLAWLIGIANVLSFNKWSDWSDKIPEGFLPGVTDRNFFAFIDFLTSNIMLPLGGFLIAIFAGWVLTRETAVEEFGMSGLGFRLWRFLVRFVIPIVIGLVLILSTAQKGFGIDLLEKIGLGGG